MPVIFFCFTILMMTRLTVFIYFMNLLFVVAFGYFFYEDLKSFLGFEPFPADLPIFASEFMNGNSLKLNSKQASDLLYDFAKTVWENEDSRKIAIFFTINFLFMLVELVYGFLSNSLGLISDSFHMLFDCTALFISLGASYISKLEPNSKYTYGFSRIETISGLFNGIFLIFIGFNVLSESIERIYEP